MACQSRSLPQLLNKKPLKVKKNNMNYYEHVERKGKGKQISPTDYKKDIYEKFGQKTNTIKIFTNGKEKKVRIDVRKFGTKSKALKNKKK